MYPNIIVNMVVVKRGFITIHNGPNIVCLYIVVKFFFVKRNIKSLYSNISFKFNLKKLSSDFIIFVQSCLFSIISSTVIMSVCHTHLHKNTNTTFIKCLSYFIYFHPSVQPSPSSSFIELELFLSFDESFLVDVFLSEDFLSELDFDESFVFLSDLLLVSSPQAEL